MQNCLYLPVFARACARSEAYNSEAIEGILNIARNSDQPRAYEVAIAAIKNLQDNAKDMLAVQETQKRIETEEGKRTCMCTDVRKRTNFASRTCWKISGRSLGIAVEVFENGR